MKFLLVNILTLLFLALVCLAYGAGTVTYTYQDFPQVNKIQFQIQSATTGEADLIVGATNVIDGQILGFTLEHDDVSTPTNNYDVYLLNPARLDLLAGQGVDMATGADKVIFSSTMGAASNEQVELRVRNAGDTKSATFTVYWK